MNRETEEQAEFSPQLGCIGQIFAIRQLEEERSRYGKWTVIIFIHFNQHLCLRVKEVGECEHATENHVPVKIIYLPQV